MKLEINYKKKNGKRTNTWRLHNTLLKPLGQDEIKEEIRKSLKTNANGNTIFQNLLDATKAVLREVSANTGLSQEKQENFA